MDAESIRKRDWTNGHTRYTDRAQLDVLGEIAAQLAEQNGIERERLAFLRESNALQHESLELSRESNRMQRALLKFDKLPELIAAEFTKCYDIHEAVRVVLEGK